jgi:hypothetical protein
MIPVTLVILVNQANPVILAIQASLAIPVVPVRL